MLISSVIMMFEMVTREGVKGLPMDKGVPGCWCDCYVRRGILLMQVTNSSVCVSVEWHVCGSRKGVINNSASSISGGRIPRGMVGVKIGADNGIGLRYKSMDWRGVGDMGGSLGGI